MGQNRQKYDLRKIARRAMIEKGLEPDFEPDVQRELQKIKSAARPKDDSVRDLRDLPWCSIDNDDSEDLDQVTVAEELSGGAIRVLVGIADVDAIVKKRSAIDGHAEKNTTSVYTGVRIFPMLPERLSTDLTSLSEGEERLAMVVEMVVDHNGSVEESDVYEALIMNHAKLTYNSVSDGLDAGNGGYWPEKVSESAELKKQLQIQDQAAQRMRMLRHMRGALDLETIEPKAVVKDGDVVDLVHEKKNRARELVEDFMIGANGVAARFLDKSGYPSVRRVVRTPRRWSRIVETAAEYGHALPSDPDPRALSAFLSERRKADPLRFPDLSLTVVKLLGAGEYVLDLPGRDPVGHFGLAVRDYAHSTAPNRRYPDLLIQRLLKAAIKEERSPYSNDELAWLAEHCTKQEDAADKVERRVRKSMCALVISGRLGEQFDGIVTGASPKGTWVRVFNPPVEGKVVRGHEGLDVGDRIGVKLVDVDVTLGYIDFVRA